MATDPAVVVRSFAQKAKSLDEYLTLAENYFAESLGSVELKVGVVNSQDNSVIIEKRDFDTLTPGLSGKLRGSSNPIVKAAISGQPMFLLGRQFINRVFDQMCEIWFEELLMEQFWVIPNSNGEILVGYTDSLNRITELEKEILSQLVELKPKDFESNRKQAIAETTEKISPRQLKILELMSEALTNNEIANALGISESLVKQETINIYEKLEVDNRKGAIKYYYQNLLFR